jgi:single-strand DNA-binding protein
MNSLTITGNLGKDCETRFLADGTAIASFSVADSMGKDKPSIWWNCSLFGKRGEALAQYLTKGQTVTVIGTVTEREYQNKDGQTVKTMDVRVQDVALQGGKRDSQQSAPAPRPAPAARQAPRPASGFDDMDSEIPF